jgi:hypothetical protein
MSRTLRVLSLALFSLVLAAPAAHADRRYFVQSYTPWLAPAGNLELETHTIALSGQSGAEATGWQNRLEFEYGVTDRFTAAAYLNFVQAPVEDAASRFDGPSLEFIYQLATPGRLPVDPAAYLEVRANGDEVEVEPKLLLARRIYKLVAVANAVGEFERITAGDAKGETEKVLELTLGASREVGRSFAFGVESVYSRELLDESPDASRWLLGPTINLQSPRVQLALGWHWQVNGSPATSGSLNLADFPRSEVRLILGVNL